MLMAAAVRAPTSVAIALFTLAVSAASLVNSPVVRLVSGSLVAQAASASAAAQAERLASGRVHDLSFCGAGTGSWSPGCIGSNGHFAGCGFPYLV